MDGVIVGGWEWVVAAYGSAGIALILYTLSLITRRRRAEEERSDGEPQQ